jgi:predicted homoserine dehydrogenase-like protein
MGFKPLVYGNIKGFLNENPTPKEMKYWSAKSGVRLYQIVSFTDGTKVVGELVFVANAFVGDVLPRAEHGQPAEDFMGSAHELGQRVLKTGKPHSDYLLSRTAPPGVFITASHDEVQQPYLRYLKQGEGPTYVLVHNTHLCHLEIPASLRRVHQGGPILMNNTSKPAFSLKSIAKLDLSPGDKIESAIGSFEVRGEAVRILDEPDHVPVGLIHQAVMKRKVPAGEIIRRDDIELPESRAYAAWEETRKRVLG